MKPFAMKYIIEKQHCSNKSTTVWLVQVLVVKLLAAVWQTAFCGVLCVLKSVAKTMLYSVLLPPCVAWWFVLERRTLLIVQLLCHGGRVWVSKPPVVRTDEKNLTCLLKLTLGSKCHLWSSVTIQIYWCCSETSRCAGHVGFGRTCPSQELCNPASSLVFRGRKVIMNQTSCH